MGKFSKLTVAMPSFIDQVNDRRERLIARKATTKPASVERKTVSIDSDYPSEAALDLIRDLKTPKLKKLTRSLF